MVEAVRPPIFTRARPWVVSPESPSASAIGSMDSTVVRVVIRMGRRRVAPASIIAVSISMV